MTWFRVDDDLPQSLKIERLEEYPTHVYSAALTTWMLLGCDCSSPARRTDGYVSRTRLLRCLPKLGESLALEAAAALVGVGLWEPSGDGWQFHDWADYQPTKAEHEAEKRARTERQRKWRQTARSKRLGVDVSVDATVDASTNASTDASTNSLRDASRDTLRDASVDGLSLVRENASVDGAPSRPVPSRPTTSSLRSDTREVEMGETEELRMEDVHRLFGAARIAAGGGGVGRDIPRTLYDPILASLSLFREEAKRRSSDAKTLVSESARAFCADPWATQHGWPEKAWLSDPGKWLVTKRKPLPHEPSPHEDFKPMSDEDFDRLFGSERSSHAGA